MEKKISPRGRFDPLDTQQPGAQTGRVLTSYYERHRERLLAYANARYRQKKMGTWVPRPARLPRPPRPSRVRLSPEEALRRERARSAAYYAANRDRVLLQQRAHRAPACMAIERAEWASGDWGNPTFRLAVLQRLLCPGSWCPAPGQWHYPFPGEVLRTVRSMRGGAKERGKYAPPVMELAVQLTGNLVCGCCRSKTRLMVPGGDLRDRPSLQHWDDGTTSLIHQGCNSFLGYFLQHGIPEARGVTCLRQIAEFNDAGLPLPAHLRVAHLCRQHFRRLLDTTLPAGV